MPLGLHQEGHLVYKICQIKHEKLPAVATPGEQPKVALLCLTL